MRLVAPLALLLLLPAATASAWSPLDWCGGSPTAWQGSPDTTWHFAANYPSDSIGDVAASQAIQAGFEGGGAPGCSDFTVAQGADANSDPLDHGSPHVVGFYTSYWGGSMGWGTLAITYPSWTYGCEMTDADIVFNDVAYDWDGSDYDLESLAAHEGGHWVGLAHTSAGSSAVMHPSNSGGTDWRTLSCDDTEAACALYPSGGTSCTADSYCACGSTCDGGWCDGVVSGDPAGDDDDDLAPADDDDIGPPDDDDVAPDDDDIGPPDDDDVDWECGGPPDETFAESEPNDWDGETDYDLVSSDGGDLTLTGHIECWADWSADIDWFVVDVPCGGDATFTLDWGVGADLDFWVYDEDLGLVAGSEAEAYEGPAVLSGFANERLYLAVSCWWGLEMAYTLTVDWLGEGHPPAPGDDDDDDDDDGPWDDDDAGGPWDDDDGGEPHDDDDDGELTDEGGGGGGDGAGDGSLVQGDIKSLGCDQVGGDAVPFGGLLLVLGWAGRARSIRRRTAARSE